MLLLMDTVTVNWVVLVFLISDRAPFDLLLVVTLIGVLKESVEPMRRLICVAAYPLIN